MQRWFLFFILGLALGIHSKAFPLKIKQEVFGDVKIYFTQIRSEADLIVFMTDVRPLERKREDIWFMDKSWPDIKIAVTNVRSAADIIVYLTNFQGQSGWVRDNPWKGKLYSFHSS